MASRTRRRSNSTGCPGPVRAARSGSMRFHWASVRSVGYARVLMLANLAKTQENGYPNRLPLPFDPVFPRETIPNRLSSLLTAQDGDAAGRVEHRGSDTEAGVAPHRPARPVSTLVYPHDSRNRPKNRRSAALD